ncbi:purple acid phosphatase, partial [Trifolium medium]|nr:purple acid phosphatase [Trifolium medium]
MGSHFPGLALSVLVIIIGCLGFDGVHCYNRPPPRKTIFVSHDGDDSSPQQ